MLSFCDSVAGGEVFGTVLAGAEFSTCGKYRYRLWRVFNAPRRIVTFIMCNPSKANHLRLDPTTKRCDSFAITWGYDGWIGVNLSPLVQTKSKLLTDDCDHADENMIAIKWAMEVSSAVVCAWGRAPFDHSWGVKMQRRAMEQMPDGMIPKHMGLTKDGHPKHPLYLPGLTKALPWTNEIGDD